MVEQCRKDPVELAPGICVLHAHIEGLAQSCIFVGKHLRGFDVPSFHSSPAILCVLLGPYHTPPHEHLMLLAALSRSLRDEQLRSDLLGTAPLGEKLDELKTRFTEQLRTLSTRHVPRTDVESR